MTHQHVVTLPDGWSATAYDNAYVTADDQRAIRAADSESDCQACEGWDIPHATHCWKSDWSTPCR